MISEIIKLGQQGAPKVRQEPWVYSASQLQTFHGCPRKWYFYYILGYPRPTTSSQQVGKDVHAEVEKHLLGVEDAEDERALALIENVKPVENVYGNESVFIEQKIRFPVRGSDLGGPWFVGYIDYLVLGDDEVTITDHKTTKDLKWAKTEYELQNDIQLMSYAYWAVTYPSPEADRVLVGHNVVTTQGLIQARYTQTVVDPAHVRARWQGHLKIVDQIENVRKIGDVRKVDPTGLQNGECQKYGGCSYSSICATAQFGKEIKMFRPPDAPVEVQEVANAEVVQPVPETETEKPSKGPNPVLERLSKLREQNVERLSKLREQNKPSDKTTKKKTVRKSRAKAKPTTEVVESEKTEEVKSTDIDMDALVSGLMAKHQVEGVKLDKGLGRIEIYLKW